MISNPKVHFAACFCMKYVKSKTTTTGCIKWFEYCEFCVCVTIYRVEKTWSERRDLFTDAVNSSACKASAIDEQNMDLWWSSTHTAKLKRFFHQKYYMDWPGVEAGLPMWKDKSMFIHTIKCTTARHRDYTRGAVRLAATCNDVLYCNVCAACCDTGAKSPGEKNGIGGQAAGGAQRGRARVKRAIS